MKDDNLNLKNQLCFPLYAAARKVTSAYTPILKPFGLTYTQYILFLVLWEKDNIQVSEICEKLFLDSGTVTPLLKKLESKGYLTRHRCECDERCVYIRLTDSGKNLKNKLSDVPSKMACCANLTPQQEQTLSSILYTILNTDKGTPSP